MRLLLILLLPGCLHYAGQFDPPPYRPYEVRTPVPRRDLTVNCGDEQIQVMVARGPGNAPLFPADTVSTGKWLSGRGNFIPFAFWSTMEGAQICGQSQEIAVWDGYAKEWRRP